MTKILVALIASSFLCAGAYAGDVDASSAPARTVKKKVKPAKKTMAKSAKPAASAATPTPAH